MNTIGTLSYFALLWPVLCSAQQSTFTVATLQIADEIWDGPPSSTILTGSVTTSIKNSAIVTAFTISCGDSQFCTNGEYLGFTVTTGSTTYNLADYGTLVCGVTDSGPGPSGTAICTETAPHGEFYTQSVSELTYTESSSYAIYFATMDPALSSSLGATTTTYIPTSAAAASAAATSTAAASTAAASTVAMTTASLTEIPVTTSTSAGISAAISTSASSTSASTAQAVQTTTSSSTSSATGSHNLTEHEKIGVGIGIVAFVLVCCAIGFFLKSYRRKRRVANRNQSELYFNTDGA
ncbi:hypothetical protein BDR22DRAFT_272058 [Usnea florida]